MRKKTKEVVNRPSHYNQGKMIDNNKAYWDALIRGLAWPNQKKPTNTGWYFLGGIIGLLLLVGLV